MIRAEMQNIDSKDTTAAYQGRYPSYYRGDNNNYNNNDNTMSFKQRPLVVYGGEQETTQKPRFVIGQMQDLGFSYFRFKFMDCFCKATM